MLLLSISRLLFYRYLEDELDVYGSILSHFRGLVCFQRSMPGNEDTDEKERPISESSASSIIYAGEGRLNRLTLEQGWMDTKRNLEKV